MTNKPPPRPSRMNLPEVVDFLIETFGYINAAARRRLKRALSDGVFHDIRPNIPYIDWGEPNWVTGEVRVVDPYSGSPVEYIYITPTLKRRELEHYFETNIDQTAPEKGSAIAAGPPSQQAAEQIGSKDGLNQNARRKGGKRTKYNQALQDAIARLRQQIGDDGKTMTLPTLKGWLRQNASYEEPFSFEPPIPNCDELYVDGQKLVWKDRHGRECDLAVRSLERYIRRANNPKKA